MSEESSELTLQNQNVQNPTAYDDEAPRDEAPEYIADPKKLIKALLFSSSEYLSIAQMKEIMPGYDTPTIQKYIKEINREIKDADEPFEIKEVNRTYLFRTKSMYYPWVKKLFKETGSRKLSQAALEILALVAYKQPITKAEIEEIRGVNVDGPLRGLLERKLIHITGKSDKIGSAFTYGTTKNFCQYFGISRVPEDLPKLTEFENLISSSNLIPQFNEEGEEYTPSMDYVSSGDRPEESPLSMESSRLENNLPEDFESANDTEISSSNTSGSTEDFSETEALNTNDSHEGPFPVDHSDSEPTSPQ